MPDLLADYRLLEQDPGRYDEMLGPHREVRAHWSGLADLLGSASSSRMAARVAAVERDIRDSGLTYNLYADPLGASRPWVLDPLPMVLPAHEWQGIEQAMAQRARLLNAVLTDLYGPQRLLAEGQIPPRLVMGHPAFQRAACGSDWAGGEPLMVYAADLARSPDGRWWVLADRTQAPSGAGYALENRLIVSRAFPELFRSMQVERLAGFFAALRDSLRERAPRGDGPPLTVLLTPGPWNETYSEHSLLARYLGLPLVEGGDLTVRNGKVWLKSVEGLQRVHAILRRQDDDYCDPLELRSDSALGVPGLVDCARRGAVLVANAIGAGVLESGALMGFLPRLCEQLLGEPLRMPSVATWWMGEPAALADAMARSAQLVFHPTHPALRGRPVFGQDLDRRGLRALEVQIRRSPEDWVAQEQVHLSQAPVMVTAPSTFAGTPSYISSGMPPGSSTEPMPGTSPGSTSGVVSRQSSADSSPWGRSRMGGSSREASSSGSPLRERPVSGIRLDPRAVALRVFAVATRTGWLVMPGGLTRVAGEPDRRVVAMQRGGGSKDTWVQSDAPITSPLTLLRSTVSAEHLVRSASASLSSRAAENLFWFGRYAERAETMARMLRVALPRLSVDADDDRPARAPLLTLAVELGLTQVSEAPETALLAAVFEEKAPGGLRETLSHLQRVAFGLRERLSVDHWRAISGLQRDPGFDGFHDLAQAMALLDRAVLALATSSGFMLDGMTRDAGWRFVSAGRRLERLRAVCSALMAACREGQAAGLDWLLEFADSSITYRSRYLGTPEWLPVLDLLISDDTNPRAIAFQLNGLSDAVARIDRIVGSDALRLVPPVLADIGRWSQPAHLNPDAALIAWLQSVSDAAAQLSDRLSMRFFSHARDVRRATFAA